MLGRSLRMVKIKVAQQGSSLVLGEPARFSPFEGYWDGCWLQKILATIFSVDAIFVTDIDYSST